MTGFAAAWLDLRRDADRRARNPAVTKALSTALEGAPVRVLDLGAGTGNNLLETAPFLQAGSTWVLADADADLLTRAPTPKGVTVETWVGDLATGLEDALRQYMPDLVTASAFYDLAGAAWIDRLVAGASKQGAMVHAVLSYTGEEVWSPPHPADGAMQEAFHAHQRSDKGLGQALGPDAHSYLADALRRAGYRVLEGPSDWDLEPPRDLSLIRELAAGTARALEPVVPDAPSWGEARRDASRVRIGHRDLFAVPAD